MRGKIGCVAEGKSRLNQARPYLGHGEEKRPNSGSQKRSVVRRRRSSTAASLAIR